MEGNLKLENISPSSHRKIPFIKSMLGIPYQKEYNLTHYHQRYDWDCGLSCILMVLSTAYRQEFLRNFDKICEDEGFGDSTWTIDLCFILKKYNVRHVYFTKTLGVDPNYAQNYYYAQIIDRDEERVKLKFKEAESHGIVVDKRTITFDAILKHLAASGPVIILTNASLLSCDICKKNKEQVFGYSGHYVVLCGYDLFRKKILYRNPEVADGHVCISSIESMDKARTAYGTDEDVIFIFFNTNSKN